MGMESYKWKTKAVKQFYAHAVAVLVLLTILSSAATVSAMVSKVPQDSRLGRLRYSHWDETNSNHGDTFPFKQVDSVQQWAKRSEYLKRQIRVSNGLWPWPTKTLTHTPLFWKKFLTFGLLWDGCDK